MDKALIAKLDVSGSKEGRSAVNFVIDPQSSLSGSVANFYLKSAILQDFIGNQSPTGLGTFDLLFQQSSSDSQASQLKLVSASLGKGETALNVEMSVYGRNLLGGGHAQPRTQ